VRSNLSKKAIQAIIKESKGSQLNSRFLPIYTMHRHTKAPSSVIQGADPAISHTLIRFHWLHILTEPETTIMKAK
jgi:hypothetical protein